MFVLLEYMSPLEKTEKACIRKPKQTGFTFLHKTKIQKNSCKRSDNHYLNPNQDPLKDTNKISFISFVKLTLDT